MLSIAAGTLYDIESRVAWLATLTVLLTYPDETVPRCNVSGKQRPTTLVGRFNSRPDDDTQFMTPIFASRGVELTFTSRGLWFARVGVRGMNTDVG